MGKGLRVHETCSTRWHYNPIEPSTHGVAVSLGGGDPWAGEKKVLSIVIYAVPVPRTVIYKAVVVPAKVEPRFWLSPSAPE